MATRQLDIQFFHMCMVAGLAIHLHLQPKLNG